MKNVSIPPSDEHLLQRIRAEFREMPCLRLTSRQAQRLFGIGEHLCTRILDHLVDTGFLARRTDGVYVRLSESLSRPSAPFTIAAGELARPA